MRSRLASKAPSKLLEEAKQLVERLDKVKSSEDFHLYAVPKSDINGVSLMEIESILFQLNARNKEYDVSEYIDVTPRSGEENLSSQEIKQKRKAEMVDFVSMISVKTLAIFRAELSKIQQELTSQATPKQISNSNRTLIHLKQKFDAFVDRGIEFSNVEEVKKIETLFKHTEICSSEQSTINVAIVELEQQSQKAIDQLTAEYQVLLNRVGSSTDTKELDACNSQYDELENRFELLKQEVVARSTTVFSSIEKLRKQYTPKQTNIRQCLILINDLASHLQQAKFPESKLTSLLEKAKAAIKNPDVKLKQYIDFLTTFNTECATVVTGYEQLIGQIATAGLREMLTELEEKQTITEDCSAFATSERNSNVFQGIAEEIMGTLHDSFLQSIGSASDARRAELEINPLAGWEEIDFPTTVITSPQTQVNQSVRSGLTPTGDSNEAQHNSDGLIQRPQHIVDPKVQKSIDLAAHFVRRKLGLNADDRLGFIQLLSKYSERAIPFFATTAVRTHRTFVREFVKKYNNTSMTDAKLMGSFQEALNRDSKILNPFGTLALICDYANKVQGESIITMNNSLAELRKKALFEKLKINNDENLVSNALAKKIVDEYVKPNGFFSFNNRHHNADLAEHLKISNINENSTAKEIYEAVFNFVEKNQDKINPQGTLAMALAVLDDLANPVSVKSEEKPAYSTANMMDRLGTGGDPTGGSSQLPEKKKTANPNQHQKNSAAAVVSSSPKKSDSEKTAVPDRRLSF